MAATSLNSGRGCGARRARATAKVVVWGTLAVLMGCSDDTTPRPRSCPAVADMDGDGISDTLETGEDFDGDGVPNRNDLDSDDDGLPDAEEGLTADCQPADSDLDGFFDFIDRDSDSDGLDDADELTLGTSSKDGDTDGDGVPDLVEVRGSRTDPTDAGSTIDLERNFFVVLPFEGDVQTRRLRFSTSIKRLDVFFLVDTTATMAGERTNLIDGIVDVVVPGVREVVQDVAFGIGGFDDYPVFPNGRGDDLPFYLLSPIAPADRDVGRWSLPSGRVMCPVAPTPGASDIGMLTAGANGVPDLLEAVSGLPCHDGGDPPESMVPALYAVATGLGLSWEEGGSVPAQTCDDPSALGYPCFRDNVIPSVVLIGDAPSHNGSGNSEAYAFPAPDYDDAVTALTDAGIRVVGVHSGSDDSDFVRLAMDTGAVRSDGSPLVFPISVGGSGLDLAIVEGVSDLALESAIDVSTRSASVDGNPGDVDGTTFIRSLVSNEGFRDGIAGEGYTRRTEDAFFGVTPGTEVEFDITFENTSRNVEAIEIHRARIFVVGDGLTELDERQVYILIPPVNEVLLI